MSKKRDASDARGEAWLEAAQASLAGPPSLLEAAQTALEAAPAVGAEKGTDAAQGVGSGTGGAKRVASAREEWASSPLMAAHAGVAFLRHPDGPMCVMALRLDMPTAAHEPVVLKTYDHSDNVTALAVRSEEEGSRGGWLVVGTREGEVVCWDILTGALR